MPTEREPAVHPSVRPSVYSERRGIWRERERERELGVVEAIGSERPAVESVRAREREREREREEGRFGAGGRRGVS